jgi:uncharacterized membrane protein YphA (DoxX/SURF4 family)
MTLKGTPAAKLLLRLGLIIVFAYAAVGSLSRPDDWIGYLPQQSLMPASLLLKLFAIYELALVVWLISAVRLRWAAWLSALTMLGVVLVNPALFAITFRDLAIACAALALAALE